MSDDPTDILDQPDARFAAFAELTAEAPRTYSGRLAGAIGHTAAATVDALAQPWVSIGPRNVGGAIRALVQDPRSPDTFYAGAPFGGLFKTDNGGITWRSIGGATMEVPIGALALAPSDSRTLWVGTGLNSSSGVLSGQGIFRSRDGGDTFAKIADVAPTAAPPDGTAERFARVVVDPLEPRRAWAATERGLWRYDPDGSAHAVGLDSGGVNIVTGGAVTDVALARDPGDADKYVLLAGVSGVGVFRGIYSRASNSSVWTAVGTARWAAGAFARVRVAFSAPRLAGDPWAYAILEDQGIAGVAAANLGWPTGLYQSTDFGATWNAPGPQPFAPAGAGWAWWPLCLAVDPRNASRVVVGYVDIQVTSTGGAGAGAWAANPILDWRNDGRGERGQHGDQHTILFDVRNAHPNRLWISNDGGVSMTEDLTVLRGSGPMANQAVWRKRSYGITAAQLVDLTTHPRLPSIFGGGMQDNGTSVSFGGPTWYRIWGGDGGQLAFDPANPRRFFPTSQTSPVEVNYNPATALNRVPLPDLDPPTTSFEPRATAPLNGLTGNGLFIGVIEGHPTASGRLLTGRSTGGFYTNTAGHVGRLTLAGSAGGMSAAAYSASNNDIWVGTENSRVYRRTSTPAAPGPAHAAIGGWTHRPLPGTAAGRISSIAVHPANANVVAVSTMPTGARGRVYLTHDAGANWTELLGTTHQLPDGPVTSLAWDPASTQVLYAGTLGGVYVVRNLVALPAGSAVVAAVDPAWHVYSQGLPIVLVNDVHVTPLTGRLRCATHARGAFECNISSTPAAFQLPSVRLSVRVHPADDSFRYVAPNVDFDDPRRPVPGAPGADYTYDRAYDVRVDAPGFQRGESFAFGDTIDGAEFDEQLVADRPLIGDTNFVYVQVMNRGVGEADNVGVHLYFAEIPAGPPPPPPPPPPVAPAIASADLSFPGEPAAASAWKRAAPAQTLGKVRAGEPSVVRFEWTPPLSVTGHVALLAIVTNDADPVGAIPDGPVVDFVRGSRHAGLRVTAVDRDTIYIRDTADDRGDHGSVAWGGRSPDVIVRRVADLPVGFDPAVAFADLGDAHLDQRIRTGDHQVFVRVHNKTALPARVQVRLWRFPLGVPAPGTDWQTIPSEAALPKVQEIAALPARGNGIVSFPWNAVADPGGPDGRGYGLMAVAQVVDATGRVLDGFPEPGAVGDIDSFWEFVHRFPGANNAAFLAIRFEAGP